MKVLTIFGTRPEAIKLAPVIKELEKNPEIVSSVCVTAQHRQMLDQVLQLFEINPNFDLDLMREDQSLFDITASILQNLEEVLKEERPDIVLVHGDTTTAFVASLAAYYFKIKIGHIEGGFALMINIILFLRKLTADLSMSCVIFGFRPRKTLNRTCFEKGPRMIKFS